MYNHILKCQVYNQSWYYHQKVFGKTWSMHIFSIYMCLFQYFPWSDKNGHVYAYRYKNVVIKTRSYSCLWLARLGTNQFQFGCRNICCSCTSSPCMYGTVWLQEYMLQLHFLSLHVWYNLAARIYAAAALPLPTCMVQFGCRNICCSCTSSTCMYGTVWL